MIDSEGPAAHIAIVVSSAAAMVGLIDGWWQQRTGDHHQPPAASRRRRTDRAASSVPANFFSSRQKVGVIPLTFADLPHAPLSNLKLDVRLLRCPAPAHLRCLPSINCPHHHCHRHDVYVVIAIRPNWQVRARGRRNQGEN